MAHHIENMAFAGATPWHGLGSQLSQNQPLEVWQREAGMDWHIEESPVRFVAGENSHLGSIHSYPEQKVLYRSDTKAPLSVVSNRYKVVQPNEVLEFYRDLTEYAGYELETAGVLKGGKKFWALARTGQSSVLKGRDEVNGYLLLERGEEPRAAVRRLAPRGVGVAATGGPVAREGPELAVGPPGGVARQVLPGRFGRGGDRRVHHGRVLRSSSTIHM